MSSLDSCVSKSAPSSNSRTFAGPTAASRSSMPFPCVRSQGNVMSYAGKDDAGTAGHNSRVPSGWRDSHENASVTFSPCSWLLHLHVEEQHGLWDLVIRSS